MTTVGERGTARSGSSNTPWFREVAARTDLFADAMLVRHDVYKVGIDGRRRADHRPARHDATTTTCSAFRLSLGRTFVPADQPESGGGPVAVISYGLWQRRFGGDPDVIGTVDHGRSAAVHDRRRHTAGVRRHPRRLDHGRDDAARHCPSSWTRGNWSTMPLIARLQPGIDSGQCRPAAAIRCSGDSWPPDVAERFRRRYLERVAVDPAARGHQRSAPAVRAGRCGC